VLQLDHAVIAVRDLEGSALAMATALGRSPSWRGRHPTYGTANVLFRLEDAYLELLAPDPEATAVDAWSGSLGRYLRERGEGLFSLALRTPDVARAVAEARARGLPAQEPAPGEGVDLRSRARRQWANARLPDEATRGTRIFFIEHRSAPAALPVAGYLGEAEGVARRLQAIEIDSAEPEGARRMWREQFGLREAPADGTGWTYDLGNSELVVRPTRAAWQPPDRFSRLVLRVASLDACEARLRLGGLAAVRDETLGRVAIGCCGARLAFTER
jgi:hypothetical protein